MSRQTTTTATRNKLLFDATVTYDLCMPAGCLTPVRTQTRLAEKKEGATPETSTNVHRGRDIRLTYACRARQEEQKQKLDDTDVTRQQATTAMATKVSTAAVTYD